MSHFQSSAIHFLSPSPTPLPPPRHPPPPFRSPLLTSPPPAGASPRGGLRPEEMPALARGRASALPKPATGRTALPAPGRRLSGARAAGGPRGSAAGARRRYVRDWRTAGRQRRAEPGRDIPVSGSHGAESFWVGERQSEEGRKATAARRESP